MYIRLLHSPHITVRVGPDKKEFGVQKDLICRASPYFTKALIGSLSEDDDRVIELDDVSAPLFRIFISWLHCSELVYDVAGDPAVIIADFFELLCKEDQDQDSTNQEQPGHCAKHHAASVPDCEFSVIPEPKKPSTWPLDVLAKLYILGDRFQVAKFRNVVIDAMWNHTEHDGWYQPTTHLIRFVYEHTTANSHLRNAIVHLTAYLRGWNEPPEAWDDTPREFLQAVMVTMGRRLPSELCMTCHSNAINENELDSANIPSLHKLQDLAPFSFNKCFYHDHATASEQEDCRKQLRLRMQDAD